MIKFEDLKIEDLLNLLPCNLLIFQDCGVWNIAEDCKCTDAIIFFQESNENFKDFVIRALKDLSEIDNFKDQIKTNINEYIAEFGQFEKKAKRNFT